MSVTGAPWVFPPSDDEDSDAVDNAQSCHSRGPARKRSRVETDEQSVSRKDEGEEEYEWMRTSTGSELDECDVPVDDDAVPEAEPDDDEEGESDKCPKQDKDEDDQYSPETHANKIHQEALQLQDADDADDEGGRITPPIGLGGGAVPMENPGNSEDSNQVPQAVPDEVETKQADEVKTAQAVKGKGREATMERVKTIRKAWHCLDDWHKTDHRVVREVTFSDDDALGSLEGETANAKLAAYVTKKMPKATRIQISAIADMLFLMLATRTEQYNDVSSLISYLTSAPPAKVMAHICIDVLHKSAGKKVSRGQVMNIYKSVAKMATQ